MLKKLVGMHFAAVSLSFANTMLRELSFILDSWLSVKISGDSQDDNDDVGSLLISTTSVEAL